jgi:hypothetical protein
MHDYTTKDSALQSKKHPYIKYIEQPDRTIKGNDSIERAQHGQEGVLVYVLSGDDSTVAQALKQGTFVPLEVGSMLIILSTRVYQWIRVESYMVAGHRLRQWPKGSNPSSMMEGTFNSSSMMGNVQGGQ